MKPYKKQNRFSLFSVNFQGIRRLGSLIGDAIAGKEYDYTAASKTYEAGKEYGYDLTISDSKELVINGDVTITDWEQAGDYEGTVNEK